ncbi:MAG: TRAP transporter small permease subunit [Bacteroidetes bacterium]|jgi:TRAP-type C4-dicarboxylate transport system permease small subunit|nr:TRAP transporter small permease subunit [Bacteroidota bacterium]
MKTLLDRILESTLFLLMVLICVSVLWGVFTRYALGSQASWSEELARFLLIWIGLLGTAWAAGQRMHLAITLLPEYLQGQQQAYLLRFIDLLVLLFAAAVLLVGGGRLVYLTNILGQSSPAMGIPMEAVYLVLPLSGLIIIYYKLSAFKNQ